MVKNKGGYVPFYHQSLLTQLTDSLLAGSKEVEQNAEYNFSGLKGQTKVSKNGLHFYSSRATLVFSSQSVEVIDTFLQHLFERGEIEVGNLQLVPESVEKEQPPVFQEELKCVCISPIVAVDPIANDFYAKKFISPDTDTFSDFLYESTMMRMERSGRFTADQIASFYRFQIIPDKTYLQKIKEGDKKFARIYPIEENGVRHEIRGYTFPFVLYSAPEVQQFIFECGMGYFSNKGFGMIDIINADLVRRTEPYHFERHPMSVNSFDKRN
ncbi:CRISPR-associated endoribonuclease Cas6 [Cytophagaceae bacterium DM2B3-1]|uniref:CRISPR-associated endoribonuclease Cas6 n=1 Tax=Xanthocytophaga flava TaxID=3048013 RepID=A0AAE3U810_9BACT|nr:CRISPR-associated endoribonuclease Cas6 [Xanthocytophaga flavus]MDJ1471614.1 CRISPR-associated endoribonuclease Cas6 [Xanthocytophaga flavus]MDJ1482192.1 CRISPR-associated endoribonuclease Cas6 [Xanthocytophaga flavus]MDJ1491742.1 CRISPR-associated endoribonuclease Cas6 [Xanthocytophaga flavus]